MGSRASLPSTPEARLQQISDADRPASTFAVKPGMDGHMGVRLLAPPGPTQRSLGPLPKRCHESGPRMIGGELVPEVLPQHRREGALLNPIQAPSGVVLLVKLLREEWIALQPRLRQHAKTRYWPRPKRPFSNRGSA